jgi:A/G-specific adenine glycosylase
MSKKPFSNTNTTEDVTRDLLLWYQNNARPLPWRSTNDPYQIWVSEVMLQQTRVETVIPYYHRFLEQFPTMNALAAAPEQSVLKAWEGLGYYRRARLLQQGAQTVISRFGGKLPADANALKTIPGIGTYMSGALASIAFNLPVPAVDGNVIRVVSRILAWEEDSSTAHSLKIITQWVKNHFPPEAGAFTQSLMELGALICLPRSPHCSQCPVYSYCQVMLTGGDPQRFPVKKALREIPTERRIILKITWNGRRLLIKRPETGLLAGLWEYPNLLAQTGDDPNQLARSWTQTQLGQALEFQVLPPMTQTFTHLHWDLEIFKAEWPAGSDPAVVPGSGWFLPEEERQLPRVAFVRLLEPSSTENTKSSFQNAPKNIK